MNKVNLTKMYQIVSLICTCSHMMISKIMSFSATISYGLYHIHKIAIHVAQTVFLNFGIDPHSGAMVVRNKLYIDGYITLCDS